MIMVLKQNIKKAQSEYSLIGRFNNGNTKRNRMQINADKIYVEKTSMLSMFSVVKKKHEK